MLPATRSLVMTVFLFLQSPSIFFFNSLISSPFLYYHPSSASLSPFKTYTSDTQIVTEKKEGGKKDKDEKRWSMGDDRTRRIKNEEEKDRKRM